MLHGLDDLPRHTDEECTRLLDRFFLPPEELLAVLAPEGWDESPLLRCYHPTPAQRREEAVAFRENLNRLARLLPRQRETAESRPNDAADEFRDDEIDSRPIDPEREAVDLVVRALWDVFSDNHTVFDEDGAYDLGSFRGSAGFLAEEANARYRGLGGRRDYLDVYMGTIWMNRRADLRPVYRWIFAGLRAAGCDWRYAFPRLYLLSFEHAPEPGDELSYDPGVALARKFQAAERERERHELQEKLDVGYNEAVEEARRRPPPAVVQAYHDVYGRWPRGWPPHPLP